MENTRKSEKFVTIIFKKKSKISKKILKIQKNFQKYFHFPSVAQGPHGDGQGVVKLDKSGKVVASPYEGGDMKPSIDQEVPQSTVVQTNGMMQNGVVGVDDDKQIYRYADG